ncbi:TPA: hypothetical protein R1956_000738 [Staphylococcus delphini]|nr:hypothetical protein [Escherichia coli]HEC2213434.1 hypothetical protein [Staphylococcus delphini]HEC2216493.1 hypothetical protein [Staphylococcus delphini]HEC2230763.1 hypothetical protein [Staphylococcus delphini]
MNEIEKVKQDLETLTSRVDDIERKTNEATSEIADLRKEYSEGHKELQESHKELKDKQAEVVNENLEQTKILNRIEERYQTQVEVAQNNEEKALVQNKWLVGAIWALVTIVMIVVITASINTLIM